MGFIKGVGGLLKGIGSVGIGAGKIGFKAGKSAGTSAIRRGAGNIAKNPTAIIAGTAAAAGAGALLAEADGDASIPGTAAKTGVAGFGLAAMSGTAGSAMALGGVGMLSAGSMALGATYAVGSRALKTPKNVGFDNMHEIKTSALGKALIGGSALIEGSVKAKDAFYRSRMGVNDGMVRSATPVIPQNLRQQGGQPDNAGATGDLVFALNNLRRG